MLVIDVLNDRALWRAATEIVVQIKVAQYDTNPPPHLKLGQQNMERELDTCGAVTLDSINVY